MLNYILLVDFRKVNDLYLMLDLALEYTGHLFHHVNLVNCTKTEVNTPLDKSMIFALLPQTICL